MATAEQFSLRWNNFQSNMTSGFHALWEGEDLVDVTLAADGRFLQAHKVVLSVCSPYFKTLFKVNPCKHPIVILKDVAYKDLEALLQFMYRGEVNVCQEELGGFLKTAEMLEVKGLTGDDGQRSSSPNSPMQQPQTLLAKQPKDRSHLPGKAVSSSMVLPEDTRGVLTPQFKRKRVSGPVSPATANSVNEDNNIRGHSEYPELTHPKLEPRDMDGDEGGDSYAEKDVNDSLATLLAGESSHSGIHAESMPGMDPTVFSSMSGHGPGDSTGSQDASQVEYIRTEKGNLKLLLGGYMYTRHRVNNGTIEWRCDRRKFCTSRLWVYCGTNNVAKISPHSHPEDHDRVKIAKLSRWVVPQDAQKWDNGEENNRFPWMIPPFFSRPKRIIQVWCPVCSRPFATKFNLRIHMRDKHSVSHDLFVCPHCGKVMKNKSCLRVHMYQKHNNVKDHQFSVAGEVEASGSEIKEYAEPTREVFSIQD